MNVNMHESTALKLRKALQVNGVFSGFCGAMILILNRQLAQWLGLEGFPLWPVGLMLCAFSGQLLWISRGRSVPVPVIRSIIYSDWAWVVGTALVLLAWGGTFSMKGIILMVDIAVVVGVFAIWQSRGLAAASGNDHTARP